LPPSAPPLAGWEPGGEGREGGERRGRRGRIGEGEIAGTEREGEK